MKIAYCIDRLSTSGGVQRVTTNKVNALAELGEEVYLITVKTDTSPYYDLNPKVKVFFLDIDISQLQRFKNRFQKHWNIRQYEQSYFQKLSSLLLQIKADIVVSAASSMVSYFPKIKDGSIKIYEIHGSIVGFEQRYKYPSNSLFWDYFVKIKTSLFKRHLRKYDCIVYLTQEGYLTWNVNKVQGAVIPNPTSWETEESSFLENKRVITVGRLVEEKNIKELIDIWKTVVAHYPNWKLDIFGEGYLYKKLQTQITELNLQESVSLCGTTSQIQEELLQSSIVVLTSLTEGLPMLLLEAQTMGIPVVSYACLTGPRDIITEGKDGFLIPMHDKTLFAEKLMLLMRDEELRKRMGAEAKESSKRFHSDVVMAQWTDLFHKFMNRKSRS